MSDKRRRRQADVRHQKENTMLMSDKRKKDARLMSDTRRKTPG